jgi:hypothetical protein
VLHSNGTVQTLPAGGTVSGIYPDPDLPETELLLAPGDTLLLYTDGVTEARGPDSDYGLDRVANLLHSCAGATAEHIAEHPWYCCVGTAASSVARWRHQRSHPGQPSHQARIVLTTWCRRAVLRSDRLRGSGGELGRSA